MLLYFLKFKVALARGKKRRKTGDPNKNDPLIQIGERHK